MLNIEHFCQLSLRVAMLNFRKVETMSLATEKP